VRPEAWRGAALARSKSKGRPLTRCVRQTERVSAGGSRERLRLLNNRTRGCAVRTIQHRPVIHAWRHSREPPAKRRLGLRHDFFRDPACRSAAVKSGSPPGLGNVGGVHWQDDEASRAKNQRFYDGDHRRN
jgi:hypothetical protein